jgi:hypothetical protein
MINEFQLKSIKKEMLAPFSCMNFSHRIIVAAAIKLINFRFAMFHYITSLSFFAVGGVIEVFIYSISQKFLASGLARVKEKTAN